MSNFDPDSFLATTLTDANSTQFVPVPIGEYLAVVEKVDARTFQGTKDPSKTYCSLDLTWNIDDAGVKQILEREKVTVRQSIMLDLNDTGTGLDMGKGKNVGLGRLREALDLNKPGEPFSFQMLQGRVAKVVVSHRPNEQKPDEVFAEVKSVAKPA